MHPGTGKDDKIVGVQPESASNDRAPKVNDSEISILPRKEQSEVNLDELESASQDQSPLWSAFTLRQKRFIVLMVSLASFFSPLSANIYFPALDVLAADFGTSLNTMNLTLTSYMIFQGLAPTIFGPFADAAGRRPAYIIGFTIYLGACIGIANSKTFAALLILRCLQSSGSASTIALGSGVVADIATSAERGVWMGWTTSSSMVAPAIAPVLGGLFTQFLSWQWIFWFLVILTVVFIIPFILLFPETGRNVVGNGSIRPQGWNMNMLDYLQYVRASRHQQQRPASPPEAKEAETPEMLSKSRKRRVPNPLDALKLIFEKDTGLLLLYNSIIYCAMYDMMTSAPSLFQAIYGFDALQIGLCFLPMGIGSFIAPIFSGHVMDWNFRRHARNAGHAIIKGKADDLRNFPLERCRIEVALPGVLVGSATLLSYGWAMQVQTSLAVPLILMFITGFAMTTSFNALSVMLVDLYSSSPATATSANNLVRCLMGAGATAVILDMIEAMGRGWCFTFIALVVLAFSPILWALEKFGPAWRETRRARIEGRPNHS